LRQAARKSRTARSAGAAARAPGPTSTPFQTDIEKRVTGAAADDAAAAFDTMIPIIDVQRGRAVAAELTEALGAQVAFVAVDVTAEHEVAAAVESVAARHDGLDVVVACAGISGPHGKSIDEITVAQWDAVMAVNVRGPFLLVKHARRYLAGSRSAAVVLLASDSGFVAAPGMVAYNASKGAVLQLTRALSVDLAGQDIRVNCVCPSIVDTPMARADLGTGPAGFAGAAFPVQSPEQVANHVLYLASAGSAPVNGISLVSDFGYLCRSSFPA
jgi:NAD(P)-dependent dehydrogenase (short-subunit alcohol dehydrogenase family)